MSVCPELKKKSEEQAELLSEVLEFLEDIVIGEDGFADLHADEIGTLLHTLRKAGVRPRESS